MPNAQPDIEVPPTKRLVEHSGHADAGLAQLQCDILLRPGHVAGIEVLQRVLGQRRLAIPPSHLQLAEA